MIVEYLRYTVPQTDLEQFMTDYKAGAEHLIVSPYANSFDLCQCVEDPTKFILRIEWTSPDDHLKGFRGSQEFKSFFARVKQYVSAIDEMRHYERRFEL